MKVLIIAVIGWTFHLMMAQEKVCSTSCNTVGMLQSTSGKSCIDIYQNNKASRGASGNYWINTTTGIHQVYCDMKLECGGHKGGWMRIADLDISRGDNCPSGWTKITTNDVGYPPIDVCRSSSDSTGCYATTFTVYGPNYHKVCGKARGYQRHTTDAFGGVGTSPRNTKSINNAYVDGLSITLGYPRKHIWTYAIGFSDELASYGNCPCAASPGISEYSFLNNDYHCESGSGTGHPNNAFLTDDPLWDGSRCISSSNNCCANANLPWFCRQFHRGQTDDIEVRICANQGFSDEAVAVDQLQLFVQ